MIFQWFIFFIMVHKHFLFWCYLAGVLPSLQISSTDHVSSNLERICIKTGVITQERDLQALQGIWVSCCKDTNRSISLKIPELTACSSNLTQTGRIAQFNLQPSSLGRRFPHPETWHTLKEAQQDARSCSERQVDSVWSAWCRCPVCGNRSQGGE